MMGDRELWSRHHYTPCFDHDTGGWGIQVTEHGRVTAMSHVTLQTQRQAMMKIHHDPPMFMNCVSCRMVTPSGKLVYDPPIHIP